MQGRRVWCRTRLAKEWLLLCHGDSAGAVSDAVADEENHILVAKRPISVQSANAIFKLCCLLSGVSARFPPVISPFITPLS